MVQDNAIEVYQEQTGGRTDESVIEYGFIHRNYRVSNLDSVNHIKSV